VVVTSNGEAQALRLSILLKFPMILKGVINIAIPGSFLSCCPLNVPKDMTMPGDKYEYKIRLSLFLIPVLIATNKRVTVGSDQKKPFELLLGRPKRPNYLWLGGGVIMGRLQSENLLLI